MLLSLEGHEVAVVHDGEQALAAFQTMQSEVVVLDIGMPKMSVYAVARRVRQGSLGRAVTLIAVTSWGQDSDRERARVQPPFHEAGQTRTLAGVALNRRER